MYAGTVRHTADGACRPVCLEPVLNSIIREKFHEKRVLHIFYKGWYELSICYSQFVRGHSPSHTADGAFRPVCLEPVLNVIIREKFHEKRVLRIFYKGWYKLSMCYPQFVCGHSPSHNAGGARRPLCLEHLLHSIIREKFHEKRVLHIFYKGWYECILICVTHRSSAGKAPSHTAGGARRSVCLEPLLNSIIREKFHEKRVLHIFYKGWYEGILICVTHRSSAGKAPSHTADGARRPVCLEPLLNSIIREKFHEKRVLRIFYKGWYELSMCYPQFVRGHSPSHTAGGARSTVCLEPLLNGIVREKFHEKRVLYIF